MVCGGMLAFDGGALALIAIRCTGIAPNERGRFARIGAKLDPPTSRGDPSAAAAHRQRQANGAAVLRLKSRAITP